MDFIANLLPPGLSAREKLRSLSRESASWLSPSTTSRLPLFRKETAQIISPNVFLAITGMACRHWAINLVTILRDQLTRTPSVHQLDPLRSHCMTTIQPNAAHRPVRQAGYGRRLASAYRR